MNKNDIKLMSESYQKVLKPIKEDLTPGLPPGPVQKETIKPVLLTDEEKNLIIEILEDQLDTSDRFSDPVFKDPQLHQDYNMKKNETEMFNELYTSVRKKNIFIAEAEDPMMVRDTGVNQYLPRVPVKNPAPVQQVPEESPKFNNEPEYNTLEDIKGAFKGFNGDETQFNRILLSEFKDNNVSMSAMLEYLAVTQGELASILN